MSRIQPTHWFEIIAVGLLTNVFFAPQFSKAAPAALQSQIASDNPILWYQLAEATGNATNFGSLGATHDAVYFGTVNRQAMTMEGDAGTAFNSTDDYLESLGTSPLTGNPTFSIETLLLLPPGGSAALWGPFLHWGDGGGGDGNPARTGREVYFSAQNNNLNHVYAGFYNAGQRTSNTAPLGQWLHIVWTRQGGNDSAAGTTIYINGQPVALQQDPNLNPGYIAASAINVGATTFRINRARDFLGVRHFTGTIDEIALYDRVLSAVEVQDHACSVESLCASNPGDYNGNGVVDAADYALWRNGGPLQNEVATLGTVTPEDYTAWRARFGNTSGSGSGGNALFAADNPTGWIDSVPEPNGVILAIVAVAGPFGFWHRRAREFKHLPAAEEPHTANGFSL